MKNFLLPLVAVGLALGLGLVFFGPFGPAGEGGGARGAGGEEAFLEEGETLKAPPRGEGGGAVREARRGKEAARRLPRGGDRPGAPGSGGLRLRLVRAGRGLAGVEVLRRGGGLVAGRADSLGVTDADGRLAVAGGKPGTFFLSFRGEGVPLGWRKGPYRITEGRVLDLGALEVPRPAALRGKVLLPGGTPAMGAVVRFAPPGGGSIFEVPGEEWRRRETDRTGRFLFENLPPGEALLVVRAPGYLPAERGLDLEEGQRAELSPILLRRGRGLRGVVVDERGVGVEGALVVPASIRRRGGTETKVFDPERGVHTDRKGRFSLEGLPAKVLLRVFAEGFERGKDRVVEPGIREARIVLVRLRGVAGTLVGPGAEGAEVYLVRLRDTEGAWSSFLRKTQADGGGRFRFTGTKPGSYSILAWKRGVSASGGRRILVPPSGRTGIEIPMRRTGPCRVRVRDASGKPIAGARVVAEFTKPEGMEEETSRLLANWKSADLPLAEGVTDEDGTFRLEGPWIGGLRLRVSATGFLEAVKDDLVLEGGPTEFSLVLTRGGRIEGLALRADGRPFAGGRVRIEKERAGTGGTEEASRTFRIGEFEEAKELSIDASGGFRSETLEPGLYRLRLQPEPEVRERSRARLVWSSGAGTRPLAEERVRVEAGRVARVTLRSVALAALEGRVAYRGEGVPAARVFLRPKGMKGRGAFDLREWKADGDGGFAKKNLPPGEYEIFAKPPKGGVATDPLPLVLAAGGTARKDLELGGGLVRGVLRPATGTRLDDLEVWLLRPGGMSIRRAVVQVVSISGKKGGAPREQSVKMNAPGSPEPQTPSPDGSFRFDFVPAGTWTLKVKQRDGATLHVDRFELAAGQGMDLGEIRLAAVFPVVCRVVDPSGLPVALGDLRVLEIGKDGKPGAEVWSGLVRDGACKIQGLAPGRYRLLFQKIDGGKRTSPAPLGEIEVLPDGSVRGNDLRLR